MEEVSKKEKTSHPVVRVFGYCVNKLWLLLATIIILLALVHLSLSFLLPKIDRYHNEIVNWIEQRYDVDIEVEKISAEWSVQGPVLELTQLQLKSKDGNYNALQVGKASLYFDIITSLWDQRFSTQEIVIDKADINFFINRKLGVAISQEEEEKIAIDLEDTSQTLFDTLFGQKRIRLTDSSLKLRTLSGTDFTYHIEQLDVKKFDQTHQLSGQLKYGEGGQITLVTEVFGDPSLKDSYSEIYLNGSAADISKLPWLETIALQAPQSGALSWQFWGTWKNKHWQNANALFALRDASWSTSRSSKKNEKTIKDKTIDKQNHLSAMLTWQHDDISNGYLALHHFEVSTANEKDQSGSDIFVKFSRQNEQQLSWNLLLEDFQVAPLVKYAGEVLNDKSQLAHFLSEANLAVELNYWNFDLSKKADVWQSPNIEFQFSKLEYNDWKELPKANGVSGSGQLGSLVGELHLEGEDVQLTFGKLFRQPIYAQKLVGDISWLFDDNDAIELMVDRFTLVNKDLQMEARVKYFEQEKKPVLSLYTEISHVNVSNKSLYLPTSVMSENLVNYLDNGVKSGELSLIKSVVRGPMEQFPFANNDGLFVALGQLKGATYQYLPDWPSATGLDAKLLFEGNSMDITASKAYSMSNEVISARAITKDFAAKNPILQLFLDVTSKDDSGKNLLAKSPLNSISNSLSEIQFRGKLRTKIELEVGLSKSVESKPVVKGEVILSPDRSKIITPFISAENLDGKIEFDHSGILPSRLTAQYRNRKLDASLVGKNSSSTAGLSIDVKGVLPAEGISDFLDSRWSQYFEGEMPFSSLIQFSPQDNPETTKVLFQSTMQGLSVNLPDEFGKTKSQTAELFLTLNLADHSTGEIKWRGLNGKWYWNKTQSQDNIFGSQSQISFDNKNSSEETSSNNVDADVNSDFNYGGDFSINKAMTNSDLVEPGIRASGNISQANLRNWLDFIETLNTDASSVGSADQPPLFFESISLELEELDVNLATINDSKLNIVKLIDKPWTIDLTSSQGNINLVMNSNMAWTAKLSQVDLELNEKLFAKTDSSEILVDKTLVDEILVDEITQPNLKPNLLPGDIVDIDISCSGCIVQGKDYGDILLQIRKSEQGVYFSGQSKKEKQHQLILSGRWFKPENQMTRTETSFELNSPNIGQLLKKWDLEAAIEDSSVNLVANLAWDDSPWKFDYTNAQSDMRLKLGKGYLSEISDEKGRLFSLFNLQSLVRKLTFDFKDVYKKGFFYDSITGTLQLKDGIIGSENVNIKGNVADVKLYGHTDIKNETIEQLAVITPHLTSSLPVLAAWAVEPTTGIIVFLLNKIMEPAVEVATRIDYRIHGTFDEVKVDQVKTKKEKVVVEYESESESESESELELINDKSNKAPIKEDEKSSDKGDLIKEKTESDDPVVEDSEDQLIPMKSSTH